MSGGLYNTADAEDAGVGGGRSNHALSMGATIGGGDHITLDSPTNYAWQAGPNLMWP